jgi:hypothetical protein
MGKNRNNYVMIPISFLRLVYIHGIAPESLLNMIYDFCFISQLDEIPKETQNNRIFLLNELEQFEKQYGKDARASIRIDWLEDAKNGKISFDLFRLIVAIKSIIGKKNFAKTYKNVLIYRILGCKFKDAITPEMKEDFEFWNRRRQFNKLMNTAVNRGFLQRLSSKGSRGFYISTKYKTGKDLQEAIIAKQEKWESKKEEMERASFELRKAQKEIKAKRYDKLRYKN